SDFFSFFTEAAFLGCFFFFLVGACRIAVANALKLSSASGPSLYSGVFMEQLCVISLCSFCCYLQLAWINQRHVPSKLVSRKGALKPTQAIPSTNHPRCESLSLPKINQILRPKKQTPTMPQRTRSIAGTSERRLPESP